VFCWVEIIVLRLDPVQGPGSRFWPGHRVGRVSSFFKKSKWRRFSKKNKNQWVCNQILSGQPSRQVNPPGHTGFFLPLFFLQPGPVSAPGRPGPKSTRKAGPGFKTMVEIAFQVPTRPQCSICLIDLREVI